MVIGVIVNLQLLLERNLFDMVIACTVHSCGFSFDLRLLKVLNLLSE